MARKLTKEEARNHIVGNKEEPTIDQEDYNLSLSRALNYYNQTFSLSDYKNSALDFAESINKIVPRSIQEFEFRSIGAVCRLIMREQPIKIEHIQQVVDKLDKIVENYNTTKKSEPIQMEIVKEKPIKEDSIKLQDYIGDIEDVFIDAIINKWSNIKNSSEMYSQYIRQEFSKEETKKIVNFIDVKYVQLDKIYNEYKTNSKCEQFKDAWKGIPQTRISSAMNQLVELKKMIEDSIKIDKKIKFAAKKKDRPALVQVKNINYTKTYSNIEGIHPKNVIGSSEAWIFDTETRDLIVIRSIQGTKFEAEGQTFKNVDPDKSYKKKLRSPEEQLNLFVNCVENKTKKLFKEIFDTIKTTDQKGTGRMNEKRIIIQVFK